MVVSLNSVLACGNLHVETPLVPLPSVHTVPSGSVSPASSFQGLTSPAPTPIPASSSMLLDIISSVTSNCEIILMTGWGIFTLFLTIGTLRSSIAFFGLFLFLTITFILLAIGYYLNDNTNWTKAGGWFGLLTALFAWYNACAALWNPGNSFIKLPLGQFPWAEKGRPHVGRKPRDYKNH